MQGRRRYSASCSAALRRWRDPPTRTSHDARRSRPRGVDEPRVLIARVVRHEIEHHPDTAIGCRSMSSSSASTRRTRSPRRGNRTRRSPNRGSGSDGSGLSQMPSTPSQARWSRRVDHASRSPTPSPSESWKERGYTWYSTPCFHQSDPRSLSPRRIDDPSPDHPFEPGVAGCPLGRACDADIGFHASHEQLLPA